MADIHVGDIGTMFRLTIRDQDENIVSLDDTFVVVVVFQKPDESTIDRPAVYINDGSDGLVQYITVDGDLDQFGHWKLQAVVTKTNVSDEILQLWHSDEVKFKVKPNLE